MGALSTIVTAVSDSVIAALAAAGYPPLVPDPDGTAGRILVGPAILFEQSRAPRIIFEPLGSELKAAEYSSASSTLDTEERRKQKAFKPVFSEHIAFNVRVWGAAPGSTNPLDDYDVTRALDHQVLASVHKCAPGGYKIETSGVFDTTNVVNHLGREFVFKLTFFTPVLRALAPYALLNLTPAQIATATENRYAPADVHPVGGVTLTLPSGGSEEVEDVD